MRCYQLSEQIKQTELLNLEGEELYWVIATPEELQMKKGIFKFSAKTIQECVEEIDLPKLEVYDHYDFGLVHLMYRKDHHFTMERINFYLGKNYLILIIKEEREWIKSLEEQILSDGEEYYTPGRILYRLFDKLTEQDGNILDEIENTISELEEVLIEGKKRNYIKEIIGLRKKLLFLKRHYEPLMEISIELEENDNDLLSDKATRYFRIMSNRINRLNMRVLNLRDYVTQVREAYDAQVDIGLNKIMKVATIITIIFFPLTLIAGWYGMNFINMPELTWKYGYLYVIGLSLLSSIVSIYYFKRKGWF